MSRRSSNVERARFTVDEVVRLTLGEDASIEHGYRGYIHLKTIPGASPELIAEAGRYADRLSMNIELPSEASLKAYAPEKSITGIKRGLALTRARIDEAKRPYPRCPPPSDVGRLAIF